MVDSERSTADGVGCCGTSAADAGRDVAAMGLTRTWRLDAETAAAKKRSSGR